MNKILILLGVVVAISACDGVGSPGTNPTITAAANNCNPITGGNQCLITLSYNANGVASLALGVTYAPQQLSQFTVSSLASCPAPSGSNTQSCVVTVTYISTGTPVNENLTFTLGSATSSVIPVSGN